jgi:hypothetical protein
MRAPVVSASACCAAAAGIIASVGGLFPASTPALVAAWGATGLSIFIGLGMEDIDDPDDSGLVFMFWVGLLATGVILGLGAAAVAAYTMAAPHYPVDLILAVGAGCVSLGLLAYLVMK